MKNTVTTYRITTGMGKLLGDYLLPFLTPEERLEFNIIGYSGKTSSFIPQTQQGYLNSLNKGTFEFTQTKWDDGDFIQEFIISRSVVEL